MQIPLCLEGNSATGGALRVGHTIRRTRAELYFSRPGTQASSQRRIYCRNPIAEQIPMEGGSMAIRGILPIFAICMLAGGQPAVGEVSSWGQAQSLPEGTKIEVLLASNKTVTGTVAQVSPEGLALTRKHDSLQLARSDIRRVWSLGKGSRLKNAGIAALGGFGVGCAIGAAKAVTLSDMNNPSVGTRVGYCGAIGGLFGGAAAGVTAAIPATKRTLVYRAPDVKP